MFQAFLGAWREKVERVGMRTVDIPKETQTERRERLVRFMDEYYRSTNPQLLLKSYRVWNGVVTLFLERHRASITLRRIKVSKAVRGQGHATRGLEWLCGLADEHQVAIIGLVRPFGDKGLNREQLTAWYRRHGFRVSKDGVMFRSPRREQ